MRTDTILYQLFLQMPSLLFVLIGRDADESKGYSFTSVEVKETAFRLDGVLMPDTNDGMIYFLEVQFQRDARFYSRLFAEIFLFLRHNNSDHDWHTVVLFAHAADDDGIPQQYSDLARRVHRIHLDRLTPEQTSQHPVDLLELLILPDDAALVAAKARAAAERAAFVRDPAEHGRTLELLTRILMQKFSHLSYEEATMLLDVKEPALEESMLYKVILDRGMAVGKMEGKLEGKLEIAREMLREGLPVERIARITGLTAEQVTAIQ
jgi:predicted transposase/invertase (TIGR01784 family)